MRLPSRAAVLLAVSLSSPHFGAAAANASPGEDDRVLAVNGALTRTGKAGTAWRIAVDAGVSFRGEPIREVSFLTKPGDRDSFFYAQFDGARVELAGEVKSVFHGIASLNRVNRIGLYEPVALLNSSLSALAPTRTAGPRERYRHGYYLFLDGSGTGCERCYVPLLITHEALDAAANGADPTFGVVIVTYERDSIWATRGAARIEASAIDPRARTVRMNDRLYRYQEIPASEVLHLLEHPSGSIPVSRPLQINTIVPGATIPDLIADFRADEPPAGAESIGR